MAHTLGRGVGSAWKPHGRAVFRIADNGGRPVALVPVRCPSGLHALADAGYDVHETADPNGRHGDILKISCRACSALPRADHSWSLTTGGQHADGGIEFDDRPYTELVEKVRNR
ncbi:MAG TPA: hypothetical protein VGL46_21445 [Pseudonocardiaceae bacterium]